MKHIKTFENYTFKNKYQEERYKSALDKVFNAKEGDILSNDVIYSFVEYLTNKADKYDYSFVDGNLGDRLDKFDNYILKRIPISDLDLDEWQKDEDDIENYKNLYLDTKKYPPIVVEDDLSIIDGTHRANALNLAGEKFILAFIGIE